MLFLLCLVFVLLVSYVCLFFFGLFFFAFFLPFFFFFFFIYLWNGLQIPLGKMAFMPGKLVHTNEITVLLGDNYFAERSVAQSLAIADRRLLRSLP